MTTDAHGRFLWYELLTRDVDGAIAFYTRVIGWGTQQFENLDLPYTMWTVGGMPLGGIMQIPPDAGDAPPHWLAYIGTQDVDDTVRRARALGAAVYVEPRDIPDVGRFAVLADPQGAMFAVYKPGSDPAEERDPSTGQFSWHELITTDYQAARRFYFDLFGWSTTEDLDMGPVGIYAMYGRHGRPYGGMFNKPADMPAPPHWLLYALVDDLDDAVRRTRDAGGQLLHGPMEVPGGDRIAQCLDPQGAVFAMHAKKQS
jgi:uncharacterized protein